MKSESELNGLINSEVQRSDSTMGNALWITVSPVPGKYAFAQPGQGSNVPSRDYLAGYGGLAARQTPPAACPRPHGQGRPPPGLLVLVKLLYSVLN